MRRYNTAAFTLIEIMMVVGILGLVAMWGLPAIYRAAAQEPLREAVSDIVEVCSHARARAVLQGQTVELVFRPQERRVSVGGASAPVESAGPRPVSAVPLATRAAVQWSDRVWLEMLDINFVEYKDADEARVRFFPNGTCDELTVILRSERNEYRKIALEVTTGLAHVEVVR
ncbi:MAG: GspH/FimT family pseudopilin [Verrucomicrobiales bacterium]|nr:GspH/FimT family pseudopilin [Verrucomicrobiales bacterium]